MYAASGIKHNRTCFLFFMKSSLANENFPFTAHECEKVLIILAFIHTSDVCLSGRNLANSHQTVHDDQHKRREMTVDFSSTSIRRICHVAALRWSC